MKLVFALVAAAFAGVSTYVHAQDVGAAARAYRAGQAAHLVEDFASAAEYFELAHELAPNPTALRSAARARLAAGHYSAAAQLAEALITTYPADDACAALADAILDEVEAHVGWIELTCDAPCVASVDGRAQLGAVDQTEHILYARPGRHSVEVSFGQGRLVRERVVVQRNEELSLSVSLPDDGSEATEAHPEPSVVEEPAEAQSELRPSPSDVRARENGERVSRPSREGRTGLPVGWFVSTTMATLVAGGFTVWSGVDVLRAHDRFLEMPTQEGLDDGKGRELRTNVLLGTTSALALTSLVVAFLTDWGSEGDSPLAIELAPGRASASVHGSF